MTAVAIAGCAATTEDGTVSIPLAATLRNAGQIGRAFLIPRGATTDIRVEVSGVPPLVTTRPVHLYTFLYDGACDRLPAKPAHALTDRVLAQSARTAGATPMAGPFTVSNTAAMSLDGAPPRRVTRSSSAPAPRTATSRSSAVRFRDRLPRENGVTMTCGGRSTAVPPK